VTNGNGPGRENQCIGKDSCGRVGGGIGGWGLTMTRNSTRDLSKQTSGGGES